MGIGTQQLKAPIVATGSIEETADGLRSHMAVPRVRSTSDAVVIGAGHNGLVAAVLLAKAGWSVTVLERNDEPGGAVRTEEVTLPGFKHDLFAMSLNAFAGSPFFAEYKKELLEHGLALANAPKPFGSLFPDGTFVGISTKAEETVESLRAISAADADAWQRLAGRFREIAPHLFPLLGKPMPSVSAVLALIGGVRALGLKWPLELARLAVQSPREFVEEHFERRELHALLASWAMHLDFGPDVPGGALSPSFKRSSSPSTGWYSGAEVREQ